MIYDKYIFIRIYLGLMMRFLLVTEEKLEDLQDEEFKKTLAK